MEHTQRQGKRTDRQTKASQDTCRYRHTGRHNTRRRAHTLQTASCRADAGEHTAKLDTAKQPEAAQRARRQQRERRSAEDTERVTGTNTQGKTQTQKDTQRTRTPSSTHGTATHSSAEEQELVSLSKRSNSVGGNKSRTGCGSTGGRATPACRLRWYASTAW